ncbi:MAG TPA: hypothetical protein VKT72_01410 [Candidatus Baltobacteraceae bacterium]|nr:hypothetical protein [Candidatus Baltobacteraceae bacterium]
MALVYGVVNIGATGTFVVRNAARSRAVFRDELMRKLPAGTEVMFCNGRDVLRLEAENPFATEPADSTVVRFVSILSKAGAVRTPLPVAFVFGTYRRDMKTISYLGKIDALFGAPATTRNWNTMLALVKILKTS